MHKGDGFSAKFLGKSPFHFQNDLSSQPVLTNGSALSLLVTIVV